MHIKKSIILCKIRERKFSIHSSFSHHAPTLSCPVPFFLLVLPICASCSSFLQNILGSTATAAGARETTCHPAGAAGPAKVTVRPDPVSTAPTPATAGRTKEAENSCSTEHAGEKAKERIQ